MSNVWAYILDDENRKLPIGVAGEIVISGKQLSDGYWKNEDLTNKSFEINPYSTCEDNKIMYHTGDLGYWNFYGEIEIIGRVDNQIKLHGFRIEPGEIEKIINDNIGIKSSVVMLKNDNLVAYYTAEKPIDKELLNERISVKVPEYMVPSYYVEMESFPLNNSGKVDRKQLPDPEIVLTDYIEPETGMEKSIFDICSRIC